MTNENITVKIPDSILSKYNGATLDYKKIPLTDAQIERYGKDSEVFEIKLNNKDNKEIDLSEETIEQTIKLNPNKKFDAIYVIRPDGSVVKLNSQINENNELVFEDNGLGTYIVSYKDENVNKEENIENMVEKENKKINIIPYIIGIITIIFISFIIYIMKKKNN